MKSINENINESASFEKMIQKNTKKRNTRLPPITKLKRNNTQKLISKNNSFIKRNNISYISNLSNINNKNFENLNKSLSNLANKLISKNKVSNISLSEKILLELFINISEFNESSFDFFVSYTNFYSMLKHKGLLDKKIYNNVIITKSDLDIILKEILTNKISSKKLNFNNFLKFIVYLSYKIDTFHFIDKPRRTVAFIIDKYFNKYDEHYNSSLIRIIYSYILSVQEEENINFILDEKISFLSEIYINFFQIDNNNDNSNNDIFDNDKNNFTSIIKALKNIGIYPILVNIKELVILYYILLDDNNENKFLVVKDIDINNTYKFKNFCQFFITLCLFIKDKNCIALKQYFYLLNKQKDDINDDNILKNGQKEGIIRFILNLNIENKYKDKDIFQVDYQYNLYNKNKGKNIYSISNDFKLNREEYDIIRKIFESYSSYIDKNFNYQLSLTDIINFLKDYNLILKNNHDNLLIEKINIAQTNSRNNINNLKRSLHSLDHLFNNKKNEKIKNSNSNNSNNNQIGLADLEILFSKAQQKQKVYININKSMEGIFLNNKNNKDYNLKIRLNFNYFVNFLNFLSNKLGFETLSEFIKYLSEGKNNENIYKLRARDINLKYIYEKYTELNSKNELVNIIQEFSPIINLYIISYKNKIKGNKITYNIFLKLFSEFEIFPNFINYSILKDIFCVLYQIKSNSKEDMDININYKEEDKKKEIDFHEIMHTFGIISLYLKDIYSVNEIQGLLALFNLIVNSDKIKPFLKGLNFNFIDVLKEKINEISKRYNIFKNEDEPEYIKYLKEPYL